MRYYIYILRCEDGSLYTGITTDPVRRLKEHGGGAKGAKYTARHRPVGYAGAWSSVGRSNASKLEYYIKTLKKSEKEALLRGEESGAFDFSAYRRENITLDGRMTAMKFICYAKCTTCKKAQAFLDERGLEYEMRDIKTENPTEEEIREWHRKSGLPLKRFFNTSGMLYREMGLSQKLPDMPEDEQFALLASDGMIVKRPILLDGDTVLVGFKQKEWEAL